MVLPAGTTFSIRSSLLSNSSGALSLLVTTSTNGSPAFTLTSSGENLLFSIVIGISFGSAARAAVIASTVSRIARIAVVSRRVIARLRVGCAVRDLGIPNVCGPVNLPFGGKAPCVMEPQPVAAGPGLYTSARGPGGLRLRLAGRRDRAGPAGDARRRAAAGDRARGRRSRRPERRRPALAA